MSTAMSSRRVAVPAPRREVHLLGSILAFLIGIVLSFAASKIDSPILAMFGFVGIGSALMYWNVSFWALVMKRQNKE